MGPFDSITIFGGATVDRIAASVGATVLGSSNPGTARAYPGGVGLNVARGLARLVRAGDPAQLSGDDDAERHRLGNADALSSRRSCPHAAGRGTGGPGA